MLMTSLIRSPPWLVVVIGYCVLYVVAIPDGDARPLGQRRVTSTHRTLDAAINVPKVMPLPLPPIPTICTPVDEYEFEPAIVLTLQGRPDELTEADMDILQLSFLQVYNMLSLQCGGDKPVVTGAFLRLEQVQITNHVQGVATIRPAPSSVANTTTQEFVLVATVNGICRGCQTTPFQLWREMTSRNRERGLMQQQQQQQQQQRQQETRRISSSKYSLSGNRGGAAGVNKGSVPAKKMPFPLLECNCLVPFKSSLIQTLNTLAPLPKSVKRVIDLDQFNPIASCPNERNFSTFLTLDFTPGQQAALNITNINTQYQQLEQAVVIAYNEANAALIAAGICDPTFTVLTSALLVVSPSSGYGPTGLNRRLTSSTPDSSYTFQMSGRCRGCSDNTPLYNDASSGNRRRLQHLKVGQHYQGGAPQPEDSWMAYGRFDPRTSRSLQSSRNLPVINNECYCPVNATQFQRPTMAQYQQALNDQLQAAQATGAVTIVSSVQNTLQVNPVNCSSQVVTFETEVAIDVSGNASSLTSSQLSALGQAFQDSYNTLAQQNCDPLFRTIESVQVVGIEPSGTRRDLSDFDVRHRQETVSLLHLSTLLLRISGRCRGCTQSTALFNDVVHTTRLLTSFMVSTETSFKLEIDNDNDLGVSNGQRVLQQVTNQTDQCYCSIAANSTSAPSLSTFTAVFNQTVASTNVTPTITVTTVAVPSNVTFPPSKAPSNQPTTTQIPTFNPSKAPVTQTSRPTVPPPSSNPSTRPSIKATQIPTVKPEAPAPLQPTILPVLPTVLPPTILPTSPSIVPLAPFLPVLPTFLPPTILPVSPSIVPPVAPSIVSPALPVAPAIVSPALPVAPTIISPALPVAPPTVSPASPEAVSPSKPPNVIATPGPSRRPSVPSIVTPTLASLTPAVDPVITPIVPVVTPVVPVLVPVVTPIVPVVTPIVPVVTPIVPVVTPVVPVVTPIVPVVTPVVPVITPVIPVFTPVVPVVSPVVPVVAPLVAPVVEPTLPVVVPVVSPVVEPTAPIVVPVVSPVIEPTLPVVSPVVTPVLTPILPVLFPEAAPSIKPAVPPSVAPTVVPVIVPVVSPSIKPTVPAVTPSIKPTVPVVIPSIKPTVPVVTPSVAPAVVPAVIPVIAPAVGPLVSPVLHPTPSLLPPI
jgi:hypothetical protein